MVNCNLTATVQALCPLPTEKSVHLCVGSHAGDPPTVIPLKVSVSHLKDDLLVEAVCASDWVVILLNVADTYTAGVL